MPEHIQVSHFGWKRVGKSSPESDTGLGVEDSETFSELLYTDRNG